MIRLILTFLLVFCSIRVEAAALLEQQVSFEGDEVTIRGMRADDLNQRLNVAFVPQTENSDSVDLTYRMIKRAGRKVLAIQLPLIQSSSVTGSLLIQVGTNNVLARLPIVIYEAPAGLDTHGGDDLPELPEDVGSGLVDSATVLASTISNFSRQVGAVSNGDTVKIALQKLEGTKVSKGAFNYEQVSSTIDIGALASEEVPVASINIAGITSTGANATIAKLTGGAAGQSVTLVFKTNNISVRDKANSGAVDSINIAGTGVQIFNTGDVLRLLYVDSKWVEIGRSLN